jgi:hypothetical protein
MALALPQLSPLWRSSLRIWLAATLTIGILLWSGRGQVLSVALVMVVMLVNENDLTPARSIAQLVACALIGILVAFVLHELSTSWVVLGIALLLTGVLIRGLGLLKGLGMGYSGCWALTLIHQGNQVNWALIFDVAFAAVVGILMAQAATWALWPRRPLQQLPALEAGIAAQLAQQIGAVQQWLAQGGAPPPPLRSQELLPSIQLLQQLNDQRQGKPASTPLARQLRRWSQSGSLWRQLLRQWLLLEPLLQQLPAPLAAHGPDQLLLSSLADLKALLQPRPAPAPASIHGGDPQRWLDQATALGASQPLLLAIGQQTKTLRLLLQGRELLKGSIEQLSSAIGP